VAEYEAFLRNAEALVRRLERKQPDNGVPATLTGKPAAMVLYNNLDSIAASSFRYPIDLEERAELALRIDRVVREQAPADWRDETRERQVLNALFPILDRDREATKAMFEIIKNQPGLLMSGHIQAAATMLIRVHQEGRKEHSSARSTHRTVV